MPEDKGYAMEEWVEMSPDEQFLKANKYLEANGMDDLEEGQPIPEWVVEKITGEKMKREGAVEANRESIYKGRQVAQQSQPRPQTIPY